VQVREVAPSVRIRGIDMEDIQGVSASEVEREAQRCYNCGCLAVAPSDVAIALVALDGGSSRQKGRSLRRIFSAPAPRVPHFSILMS